MNTIKTQWDLSGFYSSLDDPKFENDLKEVEQLVDTFCTKYKGKIKLFTEKDFEPYFQDSETIRKKVYVITHYLGYLSSLDTQNQIVIKKEGELEQKFVELSNKQLFISEEFKTIGYDKLMQFSKLKSLEKYSNYFFQKAQSLRYLLDEKTEFALNLKDPCGGSAFNQLYSELTNSFMFPIKKEGKKVLVTESEIRALRHSVNAQERKDAFKSLFNVFGDKKVQITTGNIYSALVKDSTSEVKLRGFSSVMAPRNISEELDDAVVNTLLTEVEKAYPLYHRYLKAKAKFFGQKKLSLYDMYAPLETEKKEYSFDDALKLYLDLIKRFDEEFYTYSKDMFENGRVDVFPKQGKRGGAFASYEQGFESFVLLNHADRIDDVRTLAHELGHAMHGHLSQKQPSQVYDSTLSLAETASVFNELLISTELEKQLSNSEKLGFLAHSLEDFFATIFRQVQYVLFEKRVHQAFYDGKSLTYEDFNLLWREEQEKLLGKSVKFVVKPNQEIGWSTIPHIFRTPFYCYSYAFGNLLSIALYSKYLKEGKSFVPKYKQILSAGGSKRPYELLLEHGFDISKSEFFKTGLDFIEHEVEKFEKLVFKK